MKLEVTLTDQEIETILVGACRASGYNVNTMKRLNEGCLMTYVAERNGRLPSRWKRLRSIFKQPMRLTNGTAAR